MELVKVPLSDNRALERGQSAVVTVKIVIDGGVMNKPTNRSEPTSIALGIVEAMEAQLKLVVEIGEIPIGQEKVSARTQRRRLANEVLAQTGIPPVGGAR